MNSFYIFKIVIIRVNVSKYQIIIIKQDFYPPSNHSLLV